MLPATGSIFFTRMSKSGFVLLLKRKKKDPVTTGSLNTI
jgi:hypothetical protein